MAKEMPSSLQQSEACMLAVLGATPGVMDAKLGTFGNNDPTHNFVTYRASDKDGNMATIRFYAHASGGNRIPGFMVTLPGRDAAGAKAPRDWGTGDVMRKWKAQCGVNASAHYS
jgi:hypothetical protein